MPTIRRCCIVGCLSNSREHLSMQFFQFPKPENPFSRLWKKACQASMSRILPFKKPVVCALHFHPGSIGGRRLITSAVPSLHLEVPSNLRAIEQQTMCEEIERSRKCAYINAVVYEWLIRANLNRQLRGSITHGMIKEKADSAKQIIGLNSFEPDNRWLNRFRETHLAGFAQKLAANQLKPMGPSLWIPDIVQELQHQYPPTSAENIANFENMPEQYIDYMQQYGQYADDEEQDVEEIPASPSPSSLQPPSGFDTFAHQQGYSYDKFYFERQQQEQEDQHKQRQNLLKYSRGRSSISPLSQQQRHSPYPSKSQRSKPIENVANEKCDSQSKIPDDLVEVSDDDDVEQNSQYQNDPKSNNYNNNNTNTNNKNNTNNYNSTKCISKLNGDSTTIIDESLDGDDHISIQMNNAKKIDCSTSPVSFRNDQNMVELKTYTQALEYLKPLEEFVLSKENFRAIGAISQLEEILRKAESFFEGRKSKLKPVTE